MKLYYCAWAVRNTRPVPVFVLIRTQCIASACFTAAEEPVKTGNDDLIKLLLDNDVSAIPTPPGQPIVPNVEAVAVTPATRQRRGRPFNARAPTSPPAAWFIVPTADLVRRVDESASGQLLRQEGFAVGLASRAESGEYKMHVSTAFKMPSRNFRNLFREHSPPQFGMELTQQLVDTLEMHMPGLFVQGSDRGVFASFDATENQKILLFGREWRVSTAPTPPPS